MKTQSKQNGFTLLIAILMSGLFLIIGATIFKIALVELTLSSIGKDSQIAFYAADAGAECALYWEKHYYPGGDDTSGSAFNVGDYVTPQIPPGLSFKDSNRNRIIATSLATYNPPALPIISCFRQPVQNFQVSGISAYTRFLINQAGFCVDVDVYKEDGGGGSLKTTIISRGYNTCDITSPRRVQRTIRVDLI